MTNPLLQGDIQRLRDLSQKNSPSIVASILNIIFDEFQNMDGFGTEGRGDPRYNPSSEGIDSLSDNPSKTKNESAITLFKEWMEEYSNYDEDSHNIFEEAIKDL